VVRDLAGEAVLLHLGTGTYFGLDSWVRGSGITSPNTNRQRPSCRTYCRNLT